MVKTWVRAAVVLMLTVGFAPAAIAQIYQSGSTGEAVERIQLRLGVAIDGVYGSQTESAVREFQRRRGLQVDGIAGPETLNALGLSDLVTGGGNSGGGTSGSYVVVVPGNTALLLSQVRNIRPEASLARSDRGSYIRAGTFAQRSLAERVSRQLRDRGLDARVAYRPATTAR